MNMEIEQEITLYTLGKRSYEECSEEAKKRLDPKWSSDYISYNTKKEKPIYPWL